MALFDFLNSGISGNVPINQNTMVNNTAGNAIGPTWGNALQAGMTYGSRPGSSAPLIARQMGQQGMIQPMQQPAQLKTPLDKSQNDTSGLGAIVSAILQLIGI